MAENVEVTLRGTDVSLSKTVTSSADTFVSATERMRQAALAPDFDPLSEETRELQLEVQRTGEAFATATSTMARGADRAEKSVEELKGAFLDAARALREAKKDANFDATSVSAKKLQADVERTAAAYQQGMGRAAASQRQVEAAARATGLAVDRIVTTGPQREIEELRARLTTAQQAMLRLVSSADFDPASAEAARLREQIASLQARLQAAQASARAAADGVDELGDEAADSARQVDRLEKETGDLGGAMGKLRSALAAVGIAVGVRELVQLAGASIQVKADVDAMEASLKASGATMERDAELSRFLSAETERLGFNYIVTGKALANYEVALRDSNLSDQRRLELFRELLEVLRARNLGEQDAILVLRAIGQIASKGAISMEELRQQIGERLPGALEAAAKQLGKTRGELEKLISTGQLSAAEGLPAIIEGLREAVTDEDLNNSLDQLNKKLADFANLQIRLRQQFAEGLSEELVTGLDAASDSTDGLEQASRFLGSAIGYLGRGVRETVEAFSDLSRARAIAFGTFKEGQIDLEAMSGALEEHWGWLNVVVEGLLRLDRALVPEKYRDSGDSLRDLADATDDLSTAALRAAAIRVVSEHISRLQEEGKATPEAMAPAIHAIGLLTGAFEDADDKIPGILLNLERQATGTASVVEAETAHTVASITEMIERAGGIYKASAEDLEKIRAALVALAGSAAGLPPELDNVAYALGLVGTEAERQTALIETMAARWGEAVAAARGEIQKEAEAAEAEARKILAVIGDYGTATEEQLEAAKDALEDAREAWGLYGQALDTDLQDADASIKEHLRLVKTLKKDAEEAAEEVRKLVGQIGDLATANQEQLAAVRETILEAVEAYALAGDAIPPEIQKWAAATGTAIDANRELINAARESAREVRELITNVGGLQAANATQIDAIKESIQKALDAYELAGERIPDDLKAIAKQLGVVSTAAEEAAKKLRTVVDGLAASLKTLREAAKADDPAAGLLSQRADLAEELARIQAKTNPTSEEIDRAFELKGILFGLDSELGKIERSGPAAAVGLDQVKAAIRDFIKAAGPGVSQLSEVQREVIGNALEGLQALATTGGVTGQTIEAVFRNLANDLRGFGVDVSALDEALADTGGTIQNIAELLRQQGIEAEGSLHQQVEGYQQLDKAGQERFDQLEILRKAEQKVHEERLKQLEELEDRTVAGTGRMADAWDVVIAKCEEYRACVEATAEAH